MTVLDNTPNYDLKRDAISLETPDGKTIPLPSISEHREGDTRALQSRERVQRDSINYFPPSASRACALTFFPDLTSRAMPLDEIELSKERACLGRVISKAFRRHHVWPVLAQREVREEPGARPIQSPDQR